MYLYRTVVCLSDLLTWKTKVTRNLGDGVPVCKLRRVVNLYKGPLPPNKRDASLAVEYVHTED